MEVLSGHKRQSEIRSLDVETWSFLKYFSNFGTVRQNVYNLHGLRNALKPPKVE